MNDPRLSGNRSHPDTERNESVVPVIEVTNLHKRYGDVVAVEDVSFTVEKGEIFGILGPNGAGKTTTVECIEGLRAPDGGSVTVFGLDPRRDKVAVAQRLGAQLQESHLPDAITVAEALDLYASFYDEPADWEQLIADLGLADKRDTRFEKLSGGQKQRLSIALALVGSPEVAILDELTTGLDPQARRDTWKLIEKVRDRGVTIVLVTHFMDEAERLCDRLAVIDAGKVVAVDTPAGLIARVSREQRIQFRPTSEFDEAVLTSLADVTEVSREGDHVVVSGTGNLLYTVVTTLAAHDVVAAELRMEQANLEDAFVALTGRSFELETV